MAVVFTFLFLYFVAIDMLNAELSSLIPESYNPAINSLETIGISFDNDCIRDALEQSIAETMETLITILGCVEFDTDGNSYDSVDEIYFISPKQYYSDYSDTNNDTFNESYVFISSTNETQISLVDCLSQPSNYINFTQYCIVLTEYDINTSFASGLSSDCTFQDIVGPHMGPDNYAYNLDIINDEDPETSDDPIDFGFYYHRVIEDDPGVDIYVMDTGVMCSHDEFADLDECEAIGEDYTLGKHGTKVASVIVGTNVGIAKDFRYLGR